MYPLPLIIAKIRKSAAIRHLDGSWTFLLLVQSSQSQKADVPPLIRTNTTGPEETIVARIFFLS